MPGHFQFDEPFGASLLVTGLEAVRSFGHAVLDNGIKQLLVQIQPKRLATVRLEFDERAERFQCLQCSFEADAAGLNVVFASSSGHDCAN